MGKGQLLYWLRLHVHGTQGVDDTCSVRAMMHHHQFPAHEIEIQMQDARHAGKTFSDQVCFCRTTQFGDAQHHPLPIGDGQGGQNRRGDNLDVGDAVAGATSRGIIGVHDHLRLHASGNHAIIEYPIVTTGSSLFLEDIVRIGELAKRVGCVVGTIRYYEREGLLAEPEREGSGYRCYGPSHLETLQFVRHCRSLGMKLTEIKQLLDFRRHPDGDCSGINTLLDVQIIRVEEQITVMGILREQLTILRGECEQRQTTRGCGIMQSLNRAAQGQACPCHQEEAR